ncbi:lamin-A-like [Mugil cephalus]|uniref:lamin-A-like n=1 Tax=Mugil cephalus TaxID=48193 RepID=UPI001FB85E94|nr:lamin-A-like [Mugil cephalus]
MWLSFSHATQLQLNGTRNKIYKLKEKKKKLQKELETRNKEMEETKDKNSSSSDSQETLRDVTAVVGSDCNFISVMNWSDQDKPLGGRQLKVQINNNEPITYTFDPSVELKAGKSVTLYRPGYDEGFALRGDLVWKDLKSWRPGDRVQVSLQ